MIFNRLPFLTCTATIVILFQSAVFAVEPLNTTPVELKTGQSLPVLDIESGGEISLSENNIIERPWSSKSLAGNGKLQLLQYVAADRDALRQNKPFTKALLKKQFSPDELDTTVIVNLADTMSFVKGIVFKKVAKRKASHQATNFVLDNEGVGLRRWGVKQKSCAIILLDTNGKVLFAREGPMSELEIEQAIQLIEQRLS